MRTALALALILAFAGPAAAQTAPVPGTVASADTAASRIEGVVTDAKTGAPVMGAGVMVPALEIGAVSDREGRFVLEGVPPGTHAVRVGAFTYHMTMFEVDVPEGGPGTLDAALPPGAGAGCAAVHEHGEDGGHIEHDTD